MEALVEAQHRIFDCPREQRIGGEYDASPFVRVEILHERSDPLVGEHLQLELHEAPVGQVLAAALVAGEHIGETLPRAFGSILN